jgi:hypothetical protein
MATIVDIHNYTLLPASHPWRDAFGNPDIDTVNQRLRFTFDDIVIRDSIGSASSRISFDITFQTSIAFGFGALGATFNPGIEYSTASGFTRLNGIRYGSTNGVFGAFNNTALPYIAVQTIHCEAYMKRTAAQLASIIRYAGVTYASGWVSPTVTDWNIYAFFADNQSPYGVGADNPGVLKGAHIGPITIDYDLSDAEVDTLYNAALLPRNSFILPASTSKISYARIQREHRSEDQAELFHNYVGAMSS